MLSMVVVGRGPTAMPNPDFPVVSGAGPEAGLHSCPWGPPNSSAFPNT